MASRPKRRRLPSNVPPPPMLKLPDELILHITAELSFPSRFAFERVCRRLRTLMQQRGYADMHEISREALFAKEPPPLCYISDRQFNALLNQPLKRKVMFSRLGQHARMLRVGWWSHRSRQGFRKLTDMLKMCPQLETLACDADINIERSIKDGLEKRRKVAPLPCKPMVLVFKDTVRCEPEDLLDALSAWLNCSAVERLNFCGATESTSLLRSFSSLRVLELPECRAIAANTLSNTLERLHAERLEFGLANLMSLNGLISLKLPFPAELTVAQWRTIFSNNETSLREFGISYLHRGTSNSEAETRECLLRLSDLQLCRLQCDTNLIDICTVLRGTIPKHLQALGLLFPSPRHPLCQLAHLPHLRELHCRLSWPNSGDGSLIGFTPSFIQRDVYAFLERWPHATRLHVSIYGRNFRMQEATWREIIDRLAGSPSEYSNGSLKLEHAGSVIEVFRDGRGKQVV